jgi:hypothetical protein
MAFLSILLAKVKLHFGVTSDNSLKLKLFYLIVYLTVSMLDKIGIILVYSSLNLITTSVILSLKS